MQRVLVVGLSWIGDNIICMPALQEFHRAHPEIRLTMLVKPAMIPLWELHPTPHEIVGLDTGFPGTLRTAGRLRKGAFDAAYILPNSWRSALIPLLARIPRRTGYAGHGRRWMLTEVREMDPSLETRHQACEYMSLMVPERTKKTPEYPRLWVPEEVASKTSQLLEGLSMVPVGLIPGAARGPAKRWPEAHWIELGRRLAGREGYAVLVFGTAEEADLCGRIAAAVGPAARSLAGRTSLKEWASLLRQCGAVVANDSGGMHLAAAVGTPLVAVYGMTDPVKTGPLGERCTLLQAPGERSRDVERESVEAQERLAAISPDEVLDAVMKWLRR